MDPVKRAQFRLGMYPQLLRQCGDSATLYAKCVVEKESRVNKNDCMKEFQIFKTCMMNAAKTLKTRM